MFVETYNNRELIRFCSNELQNWKQKINGLGHDFKTRVKIRKDMDGCQLAAAFDNNGIQVGFWDGDTGWTLTTSSYALEIISHQLSK